MCKNLSTNLIVPHCYASYPHGGTSGFPLGDLGDEHDLLEFPKKDKVFSRIMSEDGQSRPQHSHTYAEILNPFGFKLTDTKPQVS